MGTTEKGSEIAAPIEEIIKSANSEVEYGAKVQLFPDTTKDLLRVFEYFKYKIGTSLDCALDLGILRNSITWYISMLEQENLLQAIYRSPDRTTGFLAKHYSADPTKWRTQPRNLQLSLFD